MNLINKTCKFAIVFALILGAASCNDKKEDSKAAAPAVSGSMNIRYVDMDSVLSNYNLAKDFNEAYLRSQNTLDAAERKKMEEINRFGSEMEHKYKNNGYLTEESFKADQNRIQKMQADAQKSLGELQQSMTAQLEQSKKQVEDSIESFMSTYAKKKGFDVILKKEATMYIDSKYDVTKDVIEGLNKNYVKVKKED